MTKINVEFRVPRKGLILLWSLGVMTGVALSLPGGAGYAMSAVFALTSVLVGREHIADVVRSLRVTASERVTPACKN